MMNFNNANSDYWNYIPANPLDDIDDITIADITHQMVYGK